MLAHAISFFMLSFCKYLRPARFSAYERSSGGGISKNFVTLACCPCHVKMPPQIPAQGGTFSVYPRFARHSPQPCPQRRFAL